MSRWERRILRFERQGRLERVDFVGKGWMALFRPGLQDVQALSIEADQCVPATPLTGRVYTWAPRGLQKMCCD